MRHSSLLRSLLALAALAGPLVSCAPYQANAPRTPVARVELYAIFLRGIQQEVVNAVGEAPHVGGRILGMYYDVEAVRQYVVYLHDVSQGIAERLPILSPPEGDTGLRQAHVAYVDAVKRLRNATSEALASSDSDLMFALYGIPFDVNSAALDMWSTCNTLQNLMRPPSDVELICGTR